MKINKKLTKTFIFSIIAIILIAIFCISNTPVTLQNDTYYSVKIGEYIQDHGIDMKDHFSWHPSLDYTYPHWLYDFLTFKIFAHFGFEGIYVATVVLACILGISVYFVNSKLSKNWIISFFITLGVIYLLKSYIAARAQLVTFILFVWEIFCIEKFLEKRKIGYAIGLVAISLLIANLHVAVWPFIFVLFLPYIAEHLIVVLSDFIIYRKLKVFNLKFNSKHSKIAEKREKYKKELDKVLEKVERVKIKRSKNLKNPYKIKMESNKNVKWLVLVMIICVLMGLLTPLGDTPFTYLYKTMKGNTTQNINEHLPMTLSAQPEVMSAIIFLLSILIFTKTKIKLSDLFIIGGLCYLMLLSKRQLTMFALVGSVVLSRLTDSMLKVYENNLILKMKKFVLKPIPIILLIVCIGSISWDNLKEKSKDNIVDDRVYPVAACDYILQNIDLSKARFYNEYNYGSYMMYRGIPVFIDSRADLYAPEFNGYTNYAFDDFLDVSTIASFYESTFSKYNITHAIMYADAKISMIIDRTYDSNYKKIYSDNYFVIYERLNSK